MDQHDPLPPAPSPPAGIHWHASPQSPPPPIPDPRHGPLPPHGPRRNGGGNTLAAFIAALGVVAGVFILGIIAGVVLVGLLGFWATGAKLEHRVQWSTYRDGGSSIVAVLPIRGVIDQRQAGFVRACVGDILANGDVDAVVLRVESPGGGVTESDEIWYEVERLKQKGLPVVASFGGIAASGGYYVACGADSIMAQETTITGSIGVIAQIMTFEKLMEKVGIAPVTLVASGSPEKSVANDPFRAWTDEDRHQIVTMLDSAYGVFSDRVRRGRTSALAGKSSLESVADGSVYTSAEAVKNGLVDSIGYLDDAVTAAEKRAGLATGSATVVVLERRPSFLGGLPFARSPESGATDLLDAERLRTLVNDLAGVRLMYLMQAR